MVVVFILSCGNMKVVISENKLDNFKEIIVKRMNTLLSKMKENEDRGFHSYEVYILENIKRVEISHMTTELGISVWINIYTTEDIDDTEEFNTEGEDFNFFRSELQYRLGKLIPHIKLFIQDIIHEDNY